MIDAEEFGTIVSELLDELPEAFSGSSTAA